MTVLKAKCARLSLLLVCIRCLVFCTLMLVLSSSAFAQPSASPPPAKTGYSVDSIQLVPNMGWPEPASAPSVPPADINTMHVEYIVLDSVILSRTQFRDKSCSPVEQLPLDSYIPLLPTPAPRKPLQGLPVLWPETERPK